MRHEGKFYDVEIMEQTIDEAVTLLRYFVAFHTPGEMPQEFQGGQLQRRLEDAREWLYPFAAR